MAPIPLIGLTAAVLAFAACGAGGPGTASAVPVDGAWELVSGAGPGGPVDAPEGHPVTATFEDGQVGGRAACNSYGASVRVTEDRFELDELSATEMACEPAAMAAEAAYFQALLAADRVRRDAARLILTGNATELVFAPIPPVPTEELVGTQWLLETLIVGETATSASGVATLRLTADGELEGSTGCRDFEGSYVVSGAEVVVTELRMLGDECPPDEAAQDELVVTVVGDGFRASVDGDVLTLTAGRDGLAYRAG